MTEQIWWYVARAGGIVSLFLAGFAVMSGLVFSSKAAGKKPGPKWQLTMHRFLGALTIVFTGAHLVGIVADSYVEFGIADLLVPFASEWKPGAVAWGIVAFYLLLAVQITSLVMKRIPRKWWKLIHAGSYALLWTGLLHGATAGSDAANPIYIGATAVMVLLVSGLTIYRIIGSRMLKKALAPAARPAT